MTIYPTVLITRSTCSQNICQWLCFLGSVFQFWLWCF